MLPDPLHPAIVHVPIARAVLIPGLAILALYLIHRGVSPRECRAAPSGYVANAAVVVALAVLTLDSTMRSPGLSSRTGPDIFVRRGPFR